ncbi:hypothetical protein K450DRAFT_244327 [Umbelopsis ramanniana AG]|uniref:WHIM1 domain-containing protein n=1 Tax=Umbelopsis ramanniana AG TaxID=1314678 RepID=A0AAD5E8A6_UMBRA|nr:uncharacterized protein K450DRAFT_244327 [Umbelopsis ramanniana AG]KAI8578963.1 hypothetical protein K450DRAFT_244327 [Umbelopsis ramanniana AG]
MMLNDQENTGIDTDIDTSRHVDKVDDVPDNSSASIVGYWDIAFIHAFACKFLWLDVPALHPCPDFQPGDLEQALMSRIKSDLIDQLICCFTSNALNRKKIYDTATIRRGLFELLQAKIKASDFLLHFNPIAGSTDFDTLEPIVKLEILRSLVEWQLEDCVAIRALMDKHCRGNRYQESNPIDVLPVGIDSKKRVYWQFGDSARLWREKHGAKTEERSQWEIVANTLEELRAFTEEIAETKSRTEKQLYMKLTNRVIPNIEESIAAREKVERKKQSKERLLALPFMNDPMTLRSRSRRPVSYRYDNVYDDEVEDDEYEELEDENTSVRTGIRSSRRIAQRDTSPQRTRSSSRLRSDNNESLEESASEHNSLLDVDDLMETDSSPTAIISSPIEL